jgi:tetratricopeptide (TPR) repeat protein
MRVHRVRIGVGLLTVLVAASGASGARNPYSDGQWQSHLDAAALAEEEGRIDDAERSLLEALREVEKPDGARMDLAFTVEALADFYRRAGRPADAETNYLRATELWERLLGSGQPRVGIPLHNLAVVYLEDCRVDEALPLISRVVQLWGRTLGAEHPERLGAIRSEANGLRKCGREGDAAELEALLP